MSVRTLLIEFIQMLELIIAALPYPDVRLIVWHDRLCRRLRALDARPGAQREAA